MWNRDLPAGIPLACPCTGDRQPVPIFQRVQKLITDPALLSTLEDLAARIEALEKNEDMVLATLLSTNRDLGIVLNRIIRGQDQVPATPPGPGPATVVADLLRALNAAPAETDAGPSYQ